MTLPAEPGTALDELADTLRAIRDGEVDAVLVHSPQGEQVYTLRCLEPPYRALIEQMSEGVVVLSPSGEAMYANPAFIAMAGRDNFIGQAVDVVFDAVSIPALKSALQSHSRFEANIGRTPVSVSVRKIPHETGDVVCLVFTDMTVHVERAAEVAALTQELALAEQREREQLALRLHDHLQQVLVAVQMQLSQIPHGEATSTPLDTARRLLDEAKRTCRDLTADLSPPALRQKDLAAALRWLAEQMGNMYGLHVSVDCAPEAAALSASATEACRVVLFSAARELLFNVVKHAGVNQAELRITCEERTLVLEVIDGGCGAKAEADAGSDHGFGLTNLRARVSRLGGTFSFESIAGTGTKARIHLPWRDR